MKYSAVQSLLDLEVGRVYFKDGFSYLVEEKSESEIKFKVDGTDEITLPLNKETVENYLDSIVDNKKENMFFKLKRDEE